MALHFELIRRQAGDDADPRPRGKRLVLAHGFTQNGRCWGEFGELLGESRDLVLVDGPGHGRSHHDDADLQTAATLLTEAGGPGIYLGYSLGGRTALHAALASPELVEGLILIGATAGLDDERDRKTRREADDALASRLINEGLPAFLDRWLAGPLFSGLSDAMAAKAERLTNRPEGLAANLRNCGTGSQQPLWGRLGELKMPVLIVAGAQDEKFAALGRRMAAAMTGTTAEVLLIPGTHAVHLEAPHQTAEAILARAEQW